MKEEILRILAKYSILPESVSDIILRDENLAFSVDIGLLKLNKYEAEKIIKNCENDIKKKLPIKKVTIILTMDKNSAQPLQPSSSKIDEPAQNTKNLLGQEILPVVGVKKIIAIASAKGGVGKSSLAANIAISLQRVGHKVALVDADIYGPSIPQLMNLDSKPSQKDGLIQPLISHNIKCISVGSLIDKSAAGVWRGPMITKILYQLIRSVDWSCDGLDVDYMIIDMPPGTGDVYLSLAEKFPLAGVAIVSTPQSLAVIDVVRSVDCFNKLKIPILGIIQNMSYFEIDGVKKYIFGKDGAKELAKKMNINFLGEVPLIQEMSDSSESRIPFVVAKANSESAMLIGKIAEEIIDKIK